MNTRKDYIEHRLMELSLKTSRDPYDDIEERRLQQELNEIVEREKMDYGCRH